jgi:hypothetical protein
MHHKIDGLPPLAQIREYSVDVGIDRNVALKQRFAAELANQRFDHFAHALILIGNRQSSAGAPQAARNAVGNAPLIGDTEYQATPAFHDSR